MKKTIFIPLLLMLFYMQGYAQQNISSSSTFTQEDNVLFEGEANLPSSEGWVTDTESLFTADQEAELEDLLTNYELTSSNEIALLTRESIAPFKDASNYAATVGNQWEVGKADSQNGVILLVCLETNLVHISVGQGMREALTDEACQEIISYIIVPEFKNENYFNGVKLGLEAIIEKLDAAQAND